MRLGWKAWVRLGGYVGRPGGEARLEGLGEGLRWTHLTSLSCSFSCLASSLFAALSMLHAEKPMCTCLQLQNSRA